MKTVLEPQKKIEVVESVDVLVCGGGPAGFVAAIAAARNGAKTLLIERYGFLGGMATAGLVGPISKFKVRGRFAVQGIPWEFVERMAERNGAVTNLPSGHVPFDPEVYKLVAMQMVRESGAGLLLHAYAVGVLMDEGRSGRCDYVIIESKSGRQAIEARYIVDCTGDADIAAFAGFPYERSRTETGETQPMTLYFRLGGVHTDEMEELMMASDTVGHVQELHDLMAEARRRGELPLFGGPWIQHGSTVHPGEVSANVTRYPGNAVDVTSLTQAECQTREDMFALIPFLKKNMPALRDAYLIMSSTQVGIRESRRIKGLYRMTEDDVLNKKDFPDTVAKGAHPIDVHLPGSHEQKLVWLKEPYNIPYRSLVPQGSHNVLVAGRCISASREAFASIRVQAQCMALGQAAGTAAALCAERSCRVDELDGALLRRRLAEQGALV